MLVDITISGQVEIDPGDLEQLQKESVSTLGVVLQQSGKNVKTRIAEVYVKEEKPVKDEPKLAKDEPNEATVEPISSSSEPIQAEKETESAEE